VLDTIFDPKSVGQVLGVAALLLGTVMLGLGFVQWFQAWVRSSQRDDPQSGRGDWENALVGYKNLRDQGVLSDEEYRKIRTLVEPHLNVPSRHGADPGPRLDRSVGPARGDVRGTPGGE